MKALHFGLLGHNQYWRG